MKKITSTFQIRALSKDEYRYLEDLLRLRVGAAVRKIGEKNELTILIRGLHQAVLEATQLEAEAPKRKRGRPKKQQAFGAHL